MVVLFASTRSIVIVKATNDLVCHWVRSEWHFQRVSLFGLCRNLHFTVSTAEVRRCLANVDVIGHLCAVDRWEEMRKENGKFEKLVVWDFQTCFQNSRDSIDSIGSSPARMLWWWKTNSVSTKLLLLQAFLFRTTEKLSKMTIIEKLKGPLNNIETKW